MSEPGSITFWLGQLKQGDPDAVQELWEGYFRRLVGLARNHLEGLPRALADEEDVALSAFHSFCRRAEEGRFPKLEDRDDLWKLLMVITCRKALQLRAHEGRDKRDWRRVVSLHGSGQQQESKEPVRNRLISQEPDPALAAEMAEQCSYLLQKLASAEQRTVALRKLEGYSNREIAESMGVVESTVERKLQAIRCCWSEEADR
jgi:RNA polymerase sigma factor (sigma-70 family)